MDRNGDLVSEGCHSTHWQQFAAINWNRLRFGRME
jgi:hypothetical protein